MCRQISLDLGKPLLVNETIPGCLDDAKRAEVAKFYTEQLSAAGFGWMGWALREGIAMPSRRGATVTTTTVSTARASIPFSPGKANCAAASSSSPKNRSSVPHGKSSQKETSMPITNDTRSVLAAGREFLDGLLE